MKLRWLFFWRRHKPKEEGTMSKHDRRRHVRRELEEAIVHAIEFTLVQKGRITRAEADKSYAMLANRAGLDGLVRPQEESSIFNLHSLKDRINVRRANNIHKPVPLPGEPTKINGRVNPKAEMERFKKLQSQLELDAKDIERSLARLTKKERLRRLQDLNPAITKEN